MISMSEPRVERGGAGCFGGNIWVGKVRRGVDIISKNPAPFPRSQDRTPGNTVGTTPDVSLPRPCRVLTRPRRRLCRLGLFSGNRLVYGWAPLSPQGTSCELIYMPQGRQHTYMPVPNITSPYNPRYEMH